MLLYVMVCYGILDKGYRDIWNENWIVACFDRKSWLSLLDGLLRFWWCVSNEPWRWNIDVGMFQRLGILGKPAGTRNPIWIPRSSSYTIWAKRCLFLKDWLFWMSCSHGLLSFFWWQVLVHSNVCGRDLHSEEYKTCPQFKDDKGDKSGDRIRKKCR